MIFVLNCLLIAAQLLLAIEGENVQYEVYITQNQELPAELKSLNLTEVFSRIDEKTLQEFFNAFSDSNGNLDIQQMFDLFSKCYDPATEHLNLDTLMYLLKLRIGENRGVDYDQLKYFIEQFYNYGGKFNLSAFLMMMQRFKGKDGRVDMEVYHSGGLLGNIVMGVVDLVKGVLSGVGNIVGGVGRSLDQAFGGFSSSHKVPIPFGGKK